MQTFLPYPSYEESAKVLDYRRLGKQRVETLQILKALHDPTYGWQNHPATNMWRGHSNSLVAYGVAICREWRSRGYKDTCLEKIQAFWQKGAGNSQPDWWGNQKVHASHRSNLLRKDLAFYSQFGWSESADLPYYWANEYET